MRRYRVYKVLVTLLLCAVLAGLWGTRLAWRMMQQDVRLTGVPTYTKLTNLMRERGADLEAVPVVHGETVSVTLQAPLRRIFGGGDRIVPAGTVVETTFFSYAQSRTGVRSCYIKLPDNDDAHRLTLHSLYTDELAELYISWLEQNDLVAAFEAETGSELTRRSAVRALQAIDREMYAHNVFLSYEVPIPITPVITASLWASWLFLPLLIGAFALIDALRRRASGVDAAHQQAESARWAATAARLAQTQPSPPKKTDAPISRHAALEAWCRTAAGYVPRSRRGAVYAELYAHLEDHAAATGGSDAAAIAAMGDAHAVGRQLRRGEWSWKGILRRVKLALTQNRWIVCYSGTDERRYAQLHHALSAAGVVFQAEELDAVSRSLGAAYASLPTGANFTDNSPRKQQPPPGAAAKLAMQRMLAQPQQTQYVIRVKQRDLALARRFDRR